MKTSRFGPTRLQSRFPTRSLATKGAAEIYCSLTVAPFRQSIRRADCANTFRINGGLVKRITWPRRLPPWEPAPVRTNARTASGLNAAVASRAECGPELVVRFIGPA